MLSHRHLAAVPWLLSAVGIWLMWRLFTRELESLVSLHVIGSIFGLQLIALTIHELAHAAVALLLRMGPIIINIGTGDHLTSFSIRGVTVVLKAWPIGGFVNPGYPQNGQWNVWRSCALSLAGPAADLAMLGAALWLQFYPPNSLLYSEMHDQVDQFLGFSIAFLLYTHIIHFIPRKAEMDGTVYDNDMRITLKAIRDHFRFPLKSEFDTALAVYFQKPNPQSREKLQSVYQKVIEAPMDPQLSRQILDSFATAVLFYCGSDLLPLAEDASVRLLRDWPDEWTIKGTRGGVLVALGHVEDGMEMLKQVVAHSPAPHDQSISCAFLALGAHYLGLHTEAKEWLNRAAAAQPNCPALDRANYEISRQLESPTSSSPAQTPAQPTLN